MVAFSLYNLGITFSLEALLSSYFLSISVISLASSSYLFFYKPVFILAYSLSASLISFRYGIFSLSVITYLTLSSIGIYSNTNRVLGFNSPIYFFSKA